MQATMDIRKDNILSLAKKNKLWLVVTLLFFDTFFYILLKMVNCTYQNWITLFAFVLLFNIVFNLLSLRKSHYKFKSFFVIWILIIYLFCFGQVLLYGFFPNYQTTKVNFIFPESESIRKALLFSYWIINFMVIGAIFSSRRRIKVNIISRKKYKKATLLFLVLFLPLQIAYILVSIRSAKLYGYDESLHTGFSGIFVQLASFYLCGFAMLLIYTMKRKKLNILIYFMEIAFLAFEMLSGSRIYAVSAVVVLTIVFLSNRKLSPLMVILYAILAYVFLQFVSSISVARTLNDFSFETILKSFFNINNNAILLAFEEFGCSIYSVILPIEQVPTLTSFGYGSTYLYSLPLFLINIPSVNIYEFMDKSCYINYLVGTAAMGGSIVGELFYNFGFYFSMVIAFLIGMIIGRVSHISDYLLKQRFNFTMVVIIMFLYTATIWIRDYFSVLIRPVVWSIIIMYIISKFVKIVTRERKIKCVQR